MIEDIFNKKNCFSEWSHVKSELIVGVYNKCPNPIVSIIIPCYKRPEYFRLSLQSALNQDCNFSYEIVVVDNNADETISQNQVVVEECFADNVFYYKNAQNIGMAGNWNRGIELARAEYITYCHDDDLLLPSCLRRLMEIQKETGKRCILSAFNTIDSYGNYVTFKDKLHRKSKKRFLMEKPYYNYFLFDQFLSSKGFGVGCLFYKRYMLELGGYNKEFYPSFDYALHCSYTYYYGCIYNVLPTFNYRIAANESLKLYDRFNDADNHFRACMMNKIHLPKFILRYISTALYNYNSIYFRRYWGNVIDDREISKRDSLILKVVNFYSQKLRLYHIVFSND